MVRNPMDGYRDIFPWKHEWTHDFAPSVLKWIDFFEDEFPGKEYWNYNQHWRASGPFLTHNGYVLDIFQGGGVHPRNQMPKDFGDEIANWIMANSRQKLVNMLWWKKRYRRTTATVDYASAQGQFVDHIHIEFDHVRLDAWAALNPSPWPPG